MLLNGYLMQRATLQRDYNEKSSEFVSLVPSTQISDLSEHLLSSKIHTFHEENTKKINIKQKELQDLQMNTKETRIEQKGKQDKEDKEEEVDVSEVDIDVEEESDIDVGEEEEEAEEAEEEEAEDQEGGYGDQSNIKVINFTKEAMEGGKDNKTSKQDGGELPTLLQDGGELPTLLQDGGEDIPTLLQEGGEELPTLLQDGGEPSNAEQIGGEVGTAVKNVVVSFF